MIEIVLSGILRRITGGYPAGKFKYPREVCKFLYGCLLCYIITGIHWLIPLVGIALYLGEKPGLGYWRGAIVRYRDGNADWPKSYDTLEQYIFQGKPEWYQLGPLAKPTIAAAYASAAVRGLIYGSLCLPLAYYQPHLIAIPIAMMIAMPLSGLIARFMPTTKILEMGSYKTGWSIDEFLEGILTAGILTLI